MEVLISFIIKNIEGYTDRKIQKDFPEDMLFIDVLREILKIVNSNITLDKIAVISAIKGLFSYDDIRKTVKEIVEMHLFEFTITKRDLVNGSNLMLKEVIPITNEEISSKDMQYGYLKPKIEPEPTPEPISEPEPLTIPEIKPLESEIIMEKISDLGTIDGKKDRLEGELYFSELEENKSAKNEIKDAKEALDKMEEMLREPSREDQLLGRKMESESINRDEFQDILIKSQENEKTLSPLAPAPPPPPKSLPPAPRSTPPLAGSAPQTPGSAPERRRSLSKPSTRESRPTPSPSPPPSEPVVTSASTEFFSFKQKKKGKKMGANLKTFDYEAEEAAPILEEEISNEGIVDDFDEDFKTVEETEEEVLSDFAETEAPMVILSPLKSAILPELAELAKEIETSKEYQKNIAIEYFDKMNPKKYYPLIIDISDLEQVTTISEENILTGERKVQVKEKMAVILKSSIVKVKPIFPGCSIVPEERYTDFDKKEDKLTFYVTPLVDDEIEAGRIEFIDSEGNIFHSAPTPTKVEDPRYARVIALYGGLASFLPKILELLGFSFTQDVEMATLLPFLQSVLGDMNLSNFIGISGIIITIIICIITVAVRKPNSVKKKFKVARVGRLKSAATAPK